MMTFTDELAAMFYRDLTRVIQQIEAFAAEDGLWIRTGGISNSAGNLALHLEGNLREYVGRLLAGVPYHRTRDSEFSAKDISKLELLERLADTRHLVMRALQGMNPETLDDKFPEDVLGHPLSTRQFLLHLFAHLNYHLGQMDYLRRMITGQSALSLAGL